MRRRPIRFSRLERALRVFTDVRPGEGITGVVLLLSVFCILTGYYLIKPAREGWLAVSVIRGLSKLEVKAYSSFGQSLALMLALPLYGWLASRWPRRALINRVSLFLTSNLLIFWLLQPGLLAPRVPYAGVTFYLWVGIFSVMMVAQFWIFAADLYSDERGKRIFPLIAIGGSSGSVFGAWLAERLVRSPLIGTYDLLLIAMLPLAAALVLLWIAERRGVTGEGAPPDVIAQPATAGDEDSTGPFEIIFNNRYLLAVAAFGLLVNWVNTNGENILYGVVQHALEGQLAESGVTDAAAVEAYIKDGTTAFYSNLYFWVNLLSLGIQALLVSRVLKFGGFAALLFLTPFVSLVSYTLMALFPLLVVIKVMKIAENSTNYSANNTARQVLWLPTSQEMLYKAKSTVDTLFVRLGDGLAALTVFVGVTLLQLGLTYFLVFNVLLVVVWALVASVIVRENRRLLLVKKTRDEARARLSPSTATR